MFDTTRYHGHRCHSCHEPCEPRYIEGGLCPACYCDEAEKDMWKQDEEPEGDEREMTPLTPEYLKQVRERSPDMKEMPNCPIVNHCHCYAGGPPEHCVCGESEKALRGWANRRITQPMTAEQREWCLQEIASVEGYERDDYRTCSDELLANGVLAAWLDYCRDKGMI